MTTCAAAVIRRTARLRLTALRPARERVIEGSGRPCEWPCRASERPSSPPTSCCCLASERWRRNRWRCDPSWTWEWVREPCRCVSRSVTASRLSPIGQRQSRESIGAYCRAVVAAHPSTPSRESGREGAGERTLSGLVRYFLKLGTFGFGGPIALVGYMHRDLVEDRGWYTEDEYQQGMAVAQAMPGPLAAQLAMWLGYLERRALGAAAVSMPFVVPPFLIVTAIAIFYAEYQGLRSEEHT